MFVYNGTDYSIVAIPLILGLLLFAAQLALCFKARAMAAKLIPVYVVCLVFLMAAVTAVSKTTGGFWDLSSLIAIILAIIGLGFGVFIALAWLIYYLAGKKRK